MNWQDIIVYIIVILASAKAVYAIIKFILPQKKKQHTGACPGCSTCDTGSTIRYKIPG